MTMKQTLIFIFIVSLAGLLVSVWAYPQLPASVPSHWNLAGEVDDTMRRETVVYLLPAVSLGLGLLLLYIPLIDPLRANVERFRKTYNGFIAGMTIFFLFLHVLILLAGLGVRYNMTYLIMPAAGILVFGIGFVLERTQPNWFLGIRTPWTLSNATVWQKTHRLGGLLFKLSGLALFLGLFLPPQTAFLLLIGLILVATLIPVVYSYFAYRAEKRL